MDNSIWRLLVGSIVDGKYRLVSLLGVGSHGGAYAAEPLDTAHSHRRVAIKLVERDPDRADQQLQDASSYTGLSHPSLLRSYTPGQCELQTIRFLYLPSDLADESLLPRITAGPMSLDEARDIGVCLAAALEYLHEQSRPLVHRDVKPANVMHTGGRWKLGDFGLLRSINDKSGARTRTIVGTPEYAPPESFDGLIAPAWDVWSLAILLHEAVTDVRPFSGETPQQLMRSICNDAPSIAEGLSDEFKELLIKCLDKDPGVRWTSQKMLEALEQLDTGVALWRYEPAAPVQRRRTVDAPAPSEDASPSPNLSHQGRGADVQHDEPDADALIVSPDGSGDCTTLAEAVSRAKPGAAITVRPGVYAGPIRLTRPVEIQGEGGVDQIVIETTGAEALSVDAAGCTVTGLTLRSRSDIHAGKHAGVNIKCGQTVLEGCTITCSSLACVSVGEEATDVTLRTCTIKDGRSGGIDIRRGSTVLLDKCKLTNNHGSAIHALSGSAVTAAECDISDGDAAGVTVDSGAACSIISSSIFDNESAGIACTDAGALTIAGASVYSNRQAGISLRGRCSADISDSDITANILSGIVIAGGADVKLNRCKIHDGRSNGIQISDSSWCIAEDCDVASNGFAGIRVSQGASLQALQCRLHGGKRNAAVVQDNSRAEFTGCDIHGNGQVGILVEEGGKANLLECNLHHSPEGGIQYCGAGTVDGCTLSNNGKSAIEALNGGSPTIRNCTLKSNEMPGILVHLSAEAVIEHCTILNNTLPGIAVGESSKALITDCTIKSGSQVGIVFWDHAKGIVDDCEISGNALDGIRIMQEAAPTISRCRINANGQYALHLSAMAAGEVNDCDLTGNAAGPAFYEQGCTTTSNQNIV